MGIMAPGNRGNLRIGQPPGGLEMKLATYLQQMADAINRMPRWSTFSGTSPNSLVTGLPGDIAVNVGSTSTTSRIWVLGGAGSVPANTGWAVVRILA